MRRNAQPPETALVCLCILAIEYRRIYVSNLQGDIIGIADNTKAWVVRYYKGVGYK